MTTTPHDAPAPDALRALLAAHEPTIVNALRLYAQRMDAAAADAPAIAMFEQEAAKARRACADIQALSTPADGGDAPTRTEVRA